MTAIAPLSDGAILVHIGMHKTGTTAMQTLFAANRDRLRELGVLYPGQRPDHHLVARSFTQRAIGPGGADKPPSPRMWSELAAELRDERCRVVLSSEFFSLARDDQPAQVV